MSIFGKNKTFKISGLDKCRVSINNYDISAFVDGKTIKTLEYDGSDIYANDICISKFLRDSYEYNAKIELKEVANPVKAPVKKEPAKVDDKINLKKDTEEAPKVKAPEVKVPETKNSSPFTLENLNIVIHGSIDAIESEGNLTVTANEISEINCEGQCNVNCDSIQGNCSFEADSNISGNITGDVTCSESLSISGNISGDVSVDANLTVKGNLETESDINCCTANIGGNAIMKSFSADDTVSIGGDFSGNIESSGNVTIKGNFNGETITAEGDVSIKR